MAGGVAGSGVSLDNAYVAPGGCACWFDDDHIIFNGPNASGIWMLRVYDIITGAITDVDGRGANMIGAAGGRYAASAAGLYANFSFHAGSHMALTKTDERGPSHPDGGIALCSDPSCTDFNVYWPDGTIEHVPATAYGLEIVGRGQFVWDSGQYGINVVTALPMIDKRVAVVNGITWVVGWMNNVGLVAQENGSNLGYILSKSPAYNQRCRNINGELRVCWSSTQGEAPGTNVNMVVDLSQPPVPLVPPVVVPTFSFQHPVLVAPFKDPAGTAGSPAEVVVNQSGQSANRPYIAASDSLGGPFKGMMDGIYSEAINPAQDLKTAEGLKTRLVLAHDATTPWTVPAGLRSCDLPSIELYLSTAETLAQSVARWHQQAQDLLAQWPGSVGVIPMFYCAGNAPPNELFTVQQVCDGLQHLSEVVNLSPRIILIMPFEYDRANGIVAHPELQQAFANLLQEQSRVGLAQLPPVPTSSWKQLRRLHMDQFQGFAKINEWGAKELYYTGVNPGDPAKHVYFNRPNAPNAGGPWEQIDFVPQGNLYAAKYAAAGVWLSIQNNGSLQSRPGDSNPGPFELFQIRQEDDTQRIILYRDDIIGFTLVVEVQQ